MATSSSDVQVNQQKVFVAKALVIASRLHGPEFGKEQRPLKANVGVFKPESPPNTASSGRRGFSRQNGSFLRFEFFPLPSISHPRPPSAANANRWAGKSQPQQAANSQAFRGWRNPPSGEGEFDEAFRQRITLTHERRHLKCRSIWIFTIMWTD